MTSILITLPSSIEWDEYQKELKAVEDYKEVMNFKVSNLPVKIKVGDRCYLCHNGFIKGWMKITGLVSGGFTCTTTGKFWAGNFVQRSGKFNEITPVEHKGFQGFRYIEEI